VPFPIQQDTLRFEDGPALLAGVEADATAGGGTLVDATPPHTWVATLVQSKALEAGEAVGLAAALIQRGNAASVCTGARLALSLEEASLGALLLHALDSLDVGELLTLDPFDKANSTEDTLLHCAHQLVDVSNIHQRHALLTHLRRAGLVELEFGLLAAHGSSSEIRLWLPAILEEVHELPDLTALNTISQRGEAEGKALALAVAQLPAATQAICRGAASIPEIELEEEE
jgi:hypothetical protein